ncbi:MAG: hypothetical protein K2K15_03890 [Anaeroplasmataceae bacterium]|nr:hypothetical protein [Anaeroplasmataceae bacterium]
MKKLILLMGDLATGKSTFAEILSKRYQICSFHKDKLKEVLGDTIGFKNREENLKLSLATIQLMNSIFLEFSKFNLDLILESNFHQNEINVLKSLAEDNGYSLLILRFEANINTLYKRYLNRMHHENRHPVHLSTTLDIYEDFKDYIERGRQETITGNILSINADDFTYQTDVSILKQIDDFMKQ